MPSPLHIGLVAFPASVHTKRWVAAIEAQGARVTVFSLTGSRIPGVPCVRIRSSGLLSRRITYASYLASGAELRAALLDSSVDLVQAIFATPNGVWAALAGVGPLVVTTMGSDVLQFVGDVAPGVYARNRFHSDVRDSWTARVSFGLRRRFYAGRVRRALNAADLVTGDNQVLVDAAVREFGVPAERARLLRWGVEPELFHVPEERQRDWRLRLRLQPGQPVVLCPRGLSALYQGDVILKGIRVLLEAGDVDAKVVILGAGYEIPRDMLAIASDLEERFENVVFERHSLTRDELCELWTLTDVFVSAPVYDGYSNAVAEGRYVGAVPVVNDTPATRELFQDGVNAVVVGSFGPEELATALRHVLANLASIKPSFARMNRPWIEAHSLLPANAGTFLRWCEEMIRPGPPGSESARPGLRA
jgi:glycosyltransferase involved in cell wall biosynthesis